MNLECTRTCNTYYSPLVPWNLSEILLSKNIEHFIALAMYIENLCICRLTKSRSCTIMKIRSQENQMAFNFMDHFLSLVDWIQWGLLNRKLLSVGATQNRQHYSFNRTVWRVLWSPHQLTGKDPSWAGDQPFLVTLWHWSQYRTWPLNRTEAGQTSSLGFKEGWIKRDNKLSFSPLYFLARIFKAWCSS